MGDGNGDKLEINELLKLKRWNTPTIYNGRGQTTNHDTTRHFNKEVVTDFMPYVGPMAGHTVTLQPEPSDRDHKKNETARKGYREHVAGVPGLEIMVLQDLDKPETYDSFWGEVSSGAHRASGCVGTTMDGTARDADEMMNAGFETIARCVCVGHAHSILVRWNCEAEAFGYPMLPGQLIHADKHGLLAIPRGGERRLLEVARSMNNNECNYVIPVDRDTAGRTKEEILGNVLETGGRSRREVKGRYGRKGKMH